MKKITQKQLDLLFYPAALLAILVGMLIARAIAGI